MMLIIILQHKDMQMKQTVIYKLRNNLELQDRPFNGSFVISSLQTDSHKSDQHRVVVDLSFPFDNSVNSGNPHDSYLGEDFHLRYPTVDSLAELVRKEGRPRLLHVKM